MSPIGIIITLIVTSLLLWLVNTRLPMNVWFRKVLNRVTIAGVILWLMGASGIWGGLRGILAIR